MYAICAGESTATKLLNRTFAVSAAVVRLVVTARMVLMANVYHNYKVGDQVLRVETDLWNRYCITGWQVGTVTRALKTKVEVLFDGSNSKRTYERSDIGICLEPFQQNRFEEVKKSTLDYDAIYELNLVYHNSQTLGKLKLRCGKFTQDEIKQVRMFTKFLKEVLHDKIQN